MAAQPTPSGYLNAAGAVVFARRLPLSLAQGWAAVTDPIRTARWIGPWSGDPSTGTVELRMTAEEGSPVSPVEIIRCEAPHLVVVTTGPGGWLLTVRIDEDDDNSDDDGGDGGGDGGDDDGGHVSPLADGEDPGDSRSGPRPGDGPHSGVAPGTGSGVNARPGPVETPAHLRHSPAVLISLEHQIDDAESAASVGPGWDYYLDRLVEAEAGRDPDALNFSADYYPALAAYYRTLLGG